MNTTSNPTSEPTFNAQELGALAHLYRGEMYRSKIWRTRLDTTTNWAVATTGIALSVAFSNRENSPTPLILVGLLVMVFRKLSATVHDFLEQSCTVAESLHLNSTSVNSNFRESTLTNPFGFKSRA